MLVMEKDLLSLDVLHGVSMVRPSSRVSLPLPRPPGPYSQTEIFKVEGHQLLTESSLPYTHTVWVVPPYIA